MSRGLGALAAAILLWAAPAEAVVQKLGYQGTLRQSGVAMTGAHTLVFRVYGQLAGGAPLWTSASMNVNFTSGRFFALLEPTGFNWESNAPFLEIEVDGTVLAPREELAASAYAMNAWQLSGKKYTTAASAPPSPAAGDLWYDTAATVLKFYDGAAWIVSGASAYTRLASTQTFSGQNTFTSRVTLSTELYVSEGFITFANSSPPPPARGRVYFDPAGQGAFKISLDGATWVALSTGASGGGLTLVTAEAAQFSGDGGAGSPLALRASSVTLQGNSFNAADRLVRLDASGRYPALDGSLIVNLPADTTKLSRAGGAMSGDLQVGDAAASTISASGYLTLAGLGSAPAAAAGRLYFDSSAGRLRLHTGAGFADIATGTIVALGAGTALLAGDQTFTGSNVFRQSVMLSTPVPATAGVPGVDSPQLALRGQAWDSLSLDSAQRQMYLRTRVTNENAWKLVADRGGADLWSLDQAGNVASLSSVTASGFFGNGAGLTGIPDASLMGLTASKLSGDVPAGSLGLAVLKTGDAMSGQLTLSGSTLTVTGQDASGYSLRLSSGISMPGGTVAAGLFVGSGAGLTNVGASQVAAANVGPGSLGSGVIASSIAVGAVLDPSIVSVSAGKLSGTVPAASLGLAVLRAGDAMGGQLTVSGSTLSVTGQDASGYSMRLSSGISMPAGTVTAGLFVGNGAELANVSAGQVAFESAGTQLTTLTRPGLSVGTHVYLTNGNLGLGNSLPGERLDVSGGVVLRQMALPAISASGQSKLAMDSGSGKVKLSENGGAFVNLIGGAGGGVTLQGTTPGISDSGHLNVNGTGLFSSLGVGANLPGARIEARGANADTYTLRLGTGVSSYQVVATTSGSLGVGTASPQATLDLYGYPGQDLLRLRDPYDGNGYLVARYSGVDGAVLGAYRSGWRPLRIAGSPVYFPDGLVGIGTTNPGARLHVLTPSAAPSDMVLVVATNSAAGSEVLRVMGDGKASVIAAPTGGPGDTLFAVSTNTATGSELLVVKGDGKIGMGVTAPAHPLHIASYSLGRPSIMVDNRSPGSSISSALRFGKNGSDKWAILTDASQANIQDLSVYDSVAGAYRLYISSEGNVSIDGPTAPQAKLDINGTVLIRALPPTPAVASAGQGKLWYDSSTNKLRLSENGGAYTAVVGGVANAVTLQPTTPGAPDAGHLNIQGHGILQQGLEVSSAAAVAGDTILKVSRDPLTAGNEVMVFKGDGTLGIGTTGPGARLHVVSAVNTSQIPGAWTQSAVFDNAAGSAQTITEMRVAGTRRGSFRSDSAGNMMMSGNASGGIYLGFDEGTGGVHVGNGALGQVAVIQSGGNLGIGTPGPTHRLDVSGGGMMLRSSMTFAGMAAPPPPAAGQASIYLDSSDGRLKGLDSGGIANLVDPSWTDDGTVVRLTSPGDNVVVQSTLTIEGNAFSVGVSTLVVKGGNIGIGTTAPGTKLHMSSGTLQVDGDASTSFKIGVSTLIVTSDGNVGIGAGPDGIGRLLVDNTGNRTALVAIQRTAGEVGLTVNYTPASGTTAIASFQQAGAEVMKVRADGNVGIGTTNPAATLDVGGTGALKMPVGTTAQRPGSPASGMMRFNSVTLSVEYYNGTAWLAAMALPTSPTATGGTETTIIEGGVTYRIHTFTASGTLTVTAPGTVEVLVVAGGGSGGNHNTTNANGGGGGGGVIYRKSFAVTAGAYPVTVGAGGAAVCNACVAKGNNGGNSVFGTLTALGGGGGASTGVGGRGLDGGSGGGGAYGGSQGAGQSTQTGEYGNSGGRSYVAWTGGGGGGAGSVGNSVTIAPNDNPDGNGGRGLGVSITGSLVYYAGGGGGGGNSSERAGDGLDGGGRGEGTTSFRNYNDYTAGVTPIGGSGTPTALANTGGGGGGGSYWACNGGWCTGSGAGGSGIVIVRYWLSQ